MIDLETKFEKFCNFSYGFSIGVSHQFKSPEKSYYILLGGVTGGSFNETTGISGVIGTATTNVSGTITWSIVAGSDARISINSSTGAVSTSSAIFSGDSAAFTVRATNGTIAIEFPFTAVGVAALPKILLESGSGLLLESGSYILLEV